MFLDDKPQGKPEPSRESRVLDPWRKVLLDVANYMEKYGHLRGSAFDIDTRAACVVGAMSQLDLIDVRDKKCPSFHACDRIEEAVGMNIVVWSDRTPTPELLAKLRAVALGG